MLKFDRMTEPPPAALQNDRAIRTRRELQDYFLLPREEMIQTRAPKPDIDMGDPSITAALKRLFNGKCAFCETRGDTEAYHFRPLGNASPAGRNRAHETYPDAHLYYSWLGSAWENLFPICHECRPYEASYFPVERDRCPLPTPEQLQRFAEEGTGLWRDYPLKEKASLLDPTDPRVRMWVHLEPSFSGHLRELSQSGRDTIEFFNLNSGDVTHRRSQAYHEYLRVIEELGPGGMRNPHYRASFDFAQLEFGGSWYLLLRRIATRLTESRPSRRMPMPREMAQFFARLVRESSGYDELRRAIDGLDQGNVDRTPSPPRRREARRPSTRRGGLILERFRIENFKGIESLSIELPDPMPRRPTRKWIAPAPSVLFLGENAVGKTSVLEALALALASPAERAVAGRPAALILDPRHFGLETAGPASARIELEFNGGSTSLTVSRDAFEDGSDHPDIEPQLPRVFAYGAFRQYAHDKVSRTSFVENLFRSESLLPNPQKWLLKLTDRRFEEVARALRIIIAGEATFGIIQRDMEAETCFLTATVERFGHTVVRARTPLDAVSSGFRSILAMTCDIFAGLLPEHANEEFEGLEQARAVVLIDEIEAHLHPRWKMRVMAGLREAMPNVTFIATTHDPLCLRGVEDEEVRVLQHAPSDVDEYSARVEVLARPPSASKMTVEQLLTSDLFQLISTDSADLDLAMAKLADERVSGGRSTLTAHEREIIQAHERDVEAALPIGSSMAHQLVQEAVAEFLAKRANRSFDQRRDLKEDTRRRILEALGESFDEAR